MSLSQKSMQPLGKEIIKEQNLWTPSTTMFSLIFTENSCRSDTIVKNTWYFHEDRPNTGL